MAVIIEILASLGLKLLGTFFASTAQQTQAAGVDSTALDYLAQLVTSAGNNTTLATGAAKYDWVFAEAVSYFKSRGIDMAISLLESLLGLAVHNWQSSTGVAGSTVSSSAVK